MLHELDMHTTAMMLDYIIGHELLQANRVVSDQFGWVHAPYGKVR
jgi:hypothetical protein